MAKIDTLQNSVDTLSNRIDTVESAVSIHLILLLAILALLVIIVGYIIIKELDRRRKTVITDDNNQKKGKSASHNNKVEIAPTEQLIKLIPNLQKEIAELQGHKVKADKYDKLKSDFEEAEQEKQTLSAEKANLKTQLKNKNTEIQAQTQEISANKELLEKVKKVDMLKDYAGKVVDYLDFCENILETASEKTDKADEETAKMMSVFLQKALFRTSEIAKWKKICGDIKDKEVAILSNDIKNCFQSTNETEQLKTFKRHCINKLKTYTNALLLLCESYGNLSRFIENASVSNIETEFKNKTTEIKSKAKEIGIIEIAEVDIFTNILNSKGVKATYGNISYPYSAVKNLNKDDIAEILEFGMKTGFEDMTETKVLIN